MDRRKQTCHMRPENYATLSNLFVSLGEITHRVHAMEMLILEACMPVHNSQGRHEGLVQALKNYQQELRNNHAYLDAELTRDIEFIVEAGKETRR